VLLEWEGFELSEDDGHLDLGWSRALEALDRTAWDTERVLELRAPRVDGASRLPPAADPYFRAERLTGGSSIDPGFSVLAGTAGSGTLAMVGGELPLQRGSAVLVPFASGAGELQGDIEALRARPPHPSAGEGRW
jgi:mannose-6-phosphate isomerase